MTAPPPDTLPAHLERLSVLLEALAINAEQFCCAADNLTPGELRGAFLVYAEALRSGRGYLDSLRQRVEKTYAD